jgi:hypothetical protein
MGTFLDAQMGYERLVVKPQRAARAVTRRATWAGIAVVGLLAIIASAVPSFAQIVGTAQLSVERRGHTATLLQDGRVLIVGGDNLTGVISQAEIVDPASQTSSLAGSTNNARTDHTATRLSDGRVLVIGGRGQNGALTSTEFYDPTTASFTAGPTMTIPRSGHTATVLANGNILIAGGDVSGRAEIFNHLTQTFSPIAANMTALRKFHSAILTSSGQVLIAGGVDPQDTVLNTAEIYDPSSQSFYLPPTDMQTPRALATMKLLGDGKVQIIGGDAELSMEVFDPVIGSFNGKALLPPNVNLLGATLSTQSRAALFSPLILQDPLLQGVLTSEQSALLNRADQSITELPSLNQALVAGGINSTQQILKSAMLVKSSSASITTDKNDYAPGQIVTITGSSFQPNEQVDIYFHEFPEEYPDIFLSAVANQQGNFSVAEFAPQEIDLGRVFTVTAVGQISGFTAQTAFKDNHTISITCNPTSAAVNSSTACTGTIGNGSPGQPASGRTVTFSSSGTGNFSSTTCVTTGTNATASCSINYTPTAIGSGTHIITASFTFSASGHAGTANTSITVTAGTFSATFNATPISDVPNGTTVLSVTIGAGPSTAVTKAELPKTFSNIASGTNVSYSYVSPLTVSATQQYRWSLSSGTGSASTQTGQTGSFNLTSTSTVSAAYVAQYQQTFTQMGLDADATGTVVMVDSVAKVLADLPFSKFVDAGATVNYSYNDPITSSLAGKQYRRSSVTGLASGFTVSGANTITGNYVARFQLTLAITSGVPGGLSNISGGTNGTFYDSGTELSLSATTPVADGTDKRWAFTNWTGDVAASPNSSNPVSVVMNQPRSIMANYTEQYQLTFTQSGISAADVNSSATIVTVNGSQKVFATPLFSAYFDSGSVVTYNYAPTVASTVSGKQYALTTPDPAPANPITVSGPATITGTYKVQYEQTFAQSGLAADATGTVVTVDGVTKGFGDLSFSKFVDAGASVTYSYNDPVTSSVAGKQYRRTSVIGPAAGFTVSGANTITGNYVAQFQQTFTHSGLTADATGTVVTVDGVTKSFGDLSFSKFVDAGVSVLYSYSDPVTSSVAGKRYRRDSITGELSGYTVSGANTVTGNYVAQLQLTLAITPGVPGGLSNISGGTNGTFYDSGTELSLSATTPVADGPVKQWRFSSWTGDVTASPNSSNPLSVVMNQPRSITANYIVQWLQTFTHSGLTADASGTVVVVDSASQTFAGLPFSKFVDQGAMVGYAYTNPVGSTVVGKRYRLASVSGPGTGYVVSGANTVTGNYTPQWQLTFTASGLPIGGDSVTGSNAVVSVASSSKSAGNLPFSDWFDDGASVPYAFSSAISTVPVSDQQYELTNASVLPASPITVCTAMTITGVYSVNFYTIHYLRPLEESTATSYFVNTGKNGRVIPVKVEIFKNGFPVVTGDVLMQVVGSNCAAGLGAAPVEEYADAGNANNGTNLFRFTSDSWIYNLDTKALGLVNNNCYRLDVYFGTIMGPTAVKLSNSVWAIFKPVR